MAWRKARFKDQEVWAQVGSDGELEVEGGRVAIRYQARAGAKLYRASAGRVVLLDGALVETLEDGVSADAAASAKSTATKKTSAGTKKGTPGGFGKAGQRTAAQAAMAVEAAQSLVHELEGKAVLCFTDGACKGNPGPAGSGASVWLPDGTRGEASLSLGRATNNVAELAAIGLALELLDERGVPQTLGGAILTDSAYAHGVLARGWKAKANQALIHQLKEALAARSKLALHWIAGHVGIEGNERADALANMGVSGVSDSRWVKPVNKGGRA